MVQVVENWADIEGEIRGVRPGELQGYKTVDVLVKDATDVDDYPNLLRQRMGEVIALNVPEPRAETLREVYESGRSNIACRARLAGSNRFFAHPEL